MMTRKQLREIIFRHTFHHVADQITDKIHPEMEAMQKRIDELEAASLEAAVYPPNSSEDSKIGRIQFEGVLRRGGGEQEPPARPMGVSEDGPGDPIDYAIYALEQIERRTWPMGYDSGHPAVAALALEARKRLQGHVERLKAETLASGPGMPVEVVDAEWRAHLQRIDPAGEMIFDKTSTPAGVDHDPAIGAHPENFRGTDGYENIT